MNGSASSDVEAMQDKGGLPLKPNQSLPHENIKIPEDLLISFAKAMAPEVRKFYQSDAGKDYYLQWLRHHPEYDCSHTNSNEPEQSA